MRFLLLILISISSNFLWSIEKNFICDTAYTFYPDLSNRAIIQIGIEREIVEAFPPVTMETVHFLYLYADFTESYSKAFQIEKSVFSDYSFKEKEDSYELGTITIDRYTGKWKSKVGKKLTRTCESVPDWKVKRALREWKEYASEETSKWYAERKKKLDKRKL
ncbi:hypothetical protein OA103_00180 [Gammaproteobacteria bacterium]|nr:hypothetical protein [Gammaproteobacteria bacterium]